MNRQIDSMEDIAEKLHELSDQIGVNIYRNVMTNLEKQEETRKKVQELKERYNEMLEKQNRIGRRLIKAFPTMGSDRHETQLMELKEYLKQRRQK